MPNKKQQAEYHRVLHNLADYIDRYIGWSLAPTHRDAPRFMNNLKAVIGHTFDELERLIKR